MSYQEPPVACVQCGEIGRHGPDCPYGPGPGARPSGPGCIGPLGCLAIVLAAVVAVAGVAWQVGAGLVLPDRGLSDDDVAAIEALVGDDWTGFVGCGGRRRGVTVDFERRATKRYDVAARVRVHRGERARGPVVDEYELTGTFRGGRLVVTGDEWSGGDPDRVDLDGEVRGAGTTRIAGTTRNQVADGACTGRFRLER